MVATEWTDLLNFAITAGYGWNNAHDILVDAGVPPMYESYEQEIYPGVCEDYGWDGDAKTIVDGYLESVGNINVVLTR